MLHITLQQFLIVALPIGIPAMASLLAAILSQDGFDRISPYINPMIAYIFLLAAALVSAYVEGQLTYDVSGLISVGTFLFSLGISGGLHALSPWLKFLSLLQTYFFSIVKAEEVTYAQPDIAHQATAQVPAVAIPAVPPIQYPSAVLPAVNPAEMPTLTFDLGGQ